MNPYDPIAASVQRLADRIREAARLEQNMGRYDDAERVRVLEAAFERVLGHSPRRSRQTSAPEPLPQ